jgi:VWFA-related protein
MFRLLVSFLLSFAVIAAAADEPVVFKSDVALSRVDAQVIDRDGRAVTGLQADDFVLRVNGQVLPIRNFASESMPIDILLLLDVSGSMQPHVRRIASAAHQALNVLADKDRVAIMVFDTSTRLRLPFRSSHDQVTSELNRLLGSEHFSRGTHITHALLDAANYVRREARPEARRAIVVLTDDQTQDEEDQERVDAALASGYIVLSFLQAPYEQPYLMSRGGRRGTWGHGGGWPGGGTGWPGGGGGGYPGGGGPVIWGPGGGGYDRSHTAGTADIAEASGGDTMRVQDASALEDTLARLRQRYALHFYVPEGAKSVDLQSIQVDLSREARLHYQDAEVRSRRVYMSGGETGERPGTTVVTRTHAPADATTEPTPRVASTDAEDDTAPKRRHAAVNDSSGPKVNTIDEGSGNSSQQTVTPAPAQPAQKGGWPRADQKSQDPN